jgi:hypothetical protein
MKRALLFKPVWLRQLSLATMIPLPPAGAESVIRTSVQTPRWIYSRNPKEKDCSAAFAEEKQLNASLTDAATSWIFYMTQPVNVHLRLLKHFDFTE